MSISAFLERPWFGSDSSGPLIMVETAFRIAIWVVAVIVIVLLAKVYVTPGFLWMVLISIVTAMLAAALLVVPFCAKHYT